MSDLRLFQIQDGTAREVQGSAVALEKSLQGLIERNLDELLGIRFLASEYSTGRKHSGRIDTLGIDENGSPVIIEYKRSMNENVINQGLFYMDWLMDPKAECTLLALGDDVQEKTLKYYVAFRRLKNFVCVEARPTRGALLLFLKVDPDTVQLEEGFTRDMRNIGHFGTGDLEVVVHDRDDLERANPLILRSYEGG